MVFGQRFQHYVFHRAQRRRVVRGHIARGYGVATDALRPKFAGHKLCKAHHCAFRRCIRRNPDAALERQHRGDTDDLAARALLDHLPRSYLTQQKHGLDVQVHHIIPILFGKIQKIGASDYAGIVNKYIQAAKLRHGLVNNLLRRAWAQRSS